MTRIEDFADWTCPNCGTTSASGTWADIDIPGCECCGSHYGRECPKCGDWFDWVWDLEKLLKATRAAACAK